MKQPANTSPFHRGEIAVQSRYGITDKARQLGERVIRDFMLEQHREFFSRLPMIITGSVDKKGTPWASIIVGYSGFIEAPDAKHLRINRRPLWPDPLAANLAAGEDIGLLGIMLENRRRNRLNGRVVFVDEQGFTVEVAQSFGNCPKFIQQRNMYIDPARLDRTPDVSQVTTDTQLSLIAQELVQASDTLFISSQFSESPGSDNNGVDVSHRGGKPGFARVDNEKTLSIPDFSGNNHFNTVGNLVLNPRAGLLFIDFKNSDLLYLAGQSEVIFEGNDVTCFRGAERVIRFHVDESVHVRAALPVQWQFRESSRFLEQTGEWCSPRAVKY